MNESQSHPNDDQLFLALISDLTTQAWIALGKWKNPITDELERNIPVAGILIDMLDMLNRKTAGNRSEVEDRYLLDSLQQLKLNYVSERDKVDEPETEESERAEDESTTESEPAQSTEAKVSSEPKASAPKSTKSTTTKKSPQGKSTSKTKKKTATKSSP
ncbi:DUF1844 domain-containing protein [Candidatus Neomarinimicrobiota bacterium]